MIKKISILILLLNALMSCTSFLNLGNRTEYYETTLKEKYAIDVIYNKTRMDTDPFEQSLPTKRYVNRFIKILYHEISKYPQNFFKRIGIAEIVLGKDLLVQGKPRAGSPYPFSGRIYFEVESSEHSHSDIYLSYAIHHEISHCVDYYLWGDLFYKWDSMDSLNVPGFTYGNGGKYALEIDYEEPEIEIGFLTTYQMTGQEEDRAVLFGYAMSDEKKNYLLEKIAEDDIIKAKYNLLQHKIKVELGLTFVNYPSN